MAVFCYNFAKYALVAMSLVFLINSIAAIVLGAWMLADKTFFVSIAQEGHHYDNGLYILLASAILMFIVAFLGCCGALRHSRCYLATFFGFMLVIVVAQLAFAGWLCAHKDRLDQLLRNSVINTVKNEYGEKECRTQIIDTIQASLECCGANGPSDWAGSKYASKGSYNALALTVSSDANNVFKVPPSCCKENVDSLACGEARNLKLAGITGPLIYSEGCTEKLMITLKSQTYHIMIIAILVLIMEIVAMILALICCCEGGSANRYKA